MSGTRMGAVKGHGTWAIGDEYNEGIHELFHNRQAGGDLASFTGQTGVV